MPFSYLPSLDSLPASDARSPLVIIDGDNVRLVQGLERVLRPQDDQSQLPTKHMGPGRAVLPPVARYYPI